MKDLIHKLDGLPLALKQAGSFMRSTRCTISQYLRYHSKESLPSHKTTDAMFRTSLNRLRNKDQGAYKLLLLWSHLDNRNISWDLLSACLKAAARGPFITEQSVPSWFRNCIENEAHFHRAVKALNDLSLIQHTIGTGTISVHPLLQ